jgi:formamidopyrimidine-DNA glycosylase
VPELPEVEVVRAGLERGVTGRRIATVDVRHPRAIRRHLAGPDDFAALLEGRRVDGAKRRGKYLWLPLDSGDALVGHLGMSGQLLVVPADKPEEAHLRVRMTFDDGGRELRFVDQRTFGGLFVVAGGADVPDDIAHIARDPLDPEFDDAAFRKALRARRTGIKRALLDQSLVSGVGNIYADEALFRAGVHPLRAAGRLSRRQYAALREAVIEALLAGIDARGATIDDYRDVEGVSGSFQDQFLVHRRAGEPCPRCGSEIVKMVVGGRGTYVCETCQPRPRTRQRRPI